MVTHFKSVQKAFWATAILTLLAGLAGCGGMFGSVDGTGFGGRPASTNPVFRDASVSQAILPLTGGTVTLMADVTDDGTLVRVWAEITKPDGSTETVDLARLTGTHYSATWTAPAVTPPQTGPVVYTIRIFARDNEGNVTRSNPFTVRLQSEAAAPVMSNLTLSVTSLPASGGAVTFSVQVSDPDGVARVWAQITGPTRATYTVDLTLTSDNTYTGTWTAPPNSSAEPVQYTVRIHAEDRAGNQSMSDPFTITLAGDTTAPVLSNPTVEPTSLPFTGGAVNLAVNVADDGSVARVWAEVTKPDGSKESVDLANRADSRYSTSWTVPAKTPPGGDPVTYSVRFVAQDMAGNTASSDPVTFQVQPDTQAPVIANTAANPNVFRFPGGDVTITVDVTDPGGVVEVTAEITRADGGQESVVLTQATGSTYNGIWRAPANTRPDDQALVHTIRVRARDQAGNTGTGEAVTVTVHSASAPPTQPTP